MRALLLGAVLALLPGLAVAAGLRHDLDVALDPAARRLTVIDRLTLPPGVRSVRLAPGLSIEALTRDENAVPYRRAGDTLTLMDGGEGPVTLRYGGALPDLVPDRMPDGGIGIGAEGAFLPAGSGWVALGGDEPPTWTLTVRVPAPFVAVASGALVAEERGQMVYAATFTENRPVETPSLFAGPWQVSERTVGDVRLRTYFHPEQESLADGFLDQSAATVARYAQSIGPYPFAGFAVVSVPVPVGYAFSGLTTIGRRVLPLPFIRGQSLDHEILHNWWGNGVRVGGGGNWAEGLTTIMADHAAAGARGDDAALRLDWLRDYAALPADRDQPLTAFRGRTHDASQVVGYGKTAFVFLMLHDRIGDEAWRVGLRRFAREQMFRDADWTDLRRAFEAETGQDLGPFFAQWLERPGAPTLTLDGVTAVDGGVRLRLRQGAPAYDLLVPVAVEDESGTRMHGVRLTGAEVTVTLPATGQRMAVTVDPDHRLFRRLAVGEAPPILRDVTLDPGSAVVLAAGADGQEAARTLAGRLIDGKARVISADGADAAESRAPLAVIGTTDGVDGMLRRLGLPPAPESLAGRGTAQVWATRRPGGAAVLVVRAADAAALAALVRPLPHYGRQGWLVFDGGKMVDRGQWPVGDTLRAVVDQAKP